MNSNTWVSTRPRPNRSASAASTPKRPCTPSPPATAYRLPAGTAAAAFTNAAASAWARASDWMRSPAGMLDATRHGHSLSWPLSVRTPALQPLCHIASAFCHIGHGMRISQLDADHLAQSRRAWRGCGHGRWRGLSWWRPRCARARDRGDRRPTRSPHRRRRRLPSLLRNAHRPRRADAPKPVRRTRPSP